MKSQEVIEEWLSLVIRNYMKEVLVLPMTPEEWVKKYYYDAKEWLEGDLK